jgi:hypothetical protein
MVVFIAIKQQTETVILYLDFEPGVDHPSPRRRRRLGSRIAIGTGKAA